MAKKTEQTAPATPASQMNRRQQFAETYRITKRSDPAIGRILLAWFVVFFAVGFAVFALLPGRGVIGWVLAAIGGSLGGMQVLQWAIDHRQSDPESARRIARSLIGLYEHQPWAADVVAPARSLLESETPTEQAP